MVSRCSGKPICVVLPISQKFAFETVPVLVWLQWTCQILGSNGQLPLKSTADSIASWTVPVLVWLQLTCHVLGSSRQLPLKGTAHSIAGWTVPVLVWLQLTCRVLGSSRQLPLKGTAHSIASRTVPVLVWLTMDVLCPLKAVVYLCYFLNIFFNTYSCRQLMVLHPWLLTLDPAGNVSSSPTLQIFQGASPFAVVALTHQSYLLDCCPLTSACSGQQTHKGMLQKWMSNIVTGQNGLPFPTVLLTHTFTFVKQSVHMLMQ